MKFRKIYNLLPQIGVLVLFCIVQMLYAQVPTLKNPNRAVQDYTNLLSEKEQTILNEKLRHYADSTSIGIVIAIVPSVQDDINFQAAQILFEWKIGQKGKDNGVLILMALDQRKVAISTGYGVEEFLTDAISKQIIMQDMIPYFKQGNYYEGFDKATTAIIKVLEGTYKKEPQKESMPLEAVIVIGIILLIIITSLVKKQDKGNHRGQSSGLDWFDMIILSNLGRNSGGFGGDFGRSSGGFGGFGGFGGGSGGGGGASGSW